MEKSAYRDEFEMNQVRHIMSSVLNTVVNRKVRPRGYSPKDIMYLPLIDGKGSSVEELLAEKEELKVKIGLIKKNWK